MLSASYLFWLISDLEFSKVESWVTFQAVLVPTPAAFGLSLSVLDKLSHYRLWHPWLLLRRVVLAIFASDFSRLSCSILNNCLKCCTFLYPAGASRWVERRIAGQLQVPKSTIDSWLPKNSRMGLPNNNGNITHLEGDCLEILPTIPDNSIFWQLVHLYPHEASPGHHCIPSDLEFSKSWVTFQAVLVSTPAAFGLSFQIIGNLSNLSKMIS